MPPLGEHAGRNQRTDRITSMTVRVDSHLSAHNASNNSETVSTRKKCAISRTPRALGTSSMTKCLPRGVTARSKAIGGDMARLRCAPAAALRRVPVSPATAPSLTCRSTDASEHTSFVSRGSTGTVTSLAGFFDGRPSSRLSRTRPHVRLPYATLVTGPAAPGSDMSGTGVNVVAREEGVSLRFGRRAVGADGRGQWKSHRVQCCQVEAVPRCSRDHDQAAVEIAGGHEARLPVVRP